MEVQGHRAGLRRRARGHRPRLRAERLTPEQLDLALARWRETLAVMSSNLLELEALPVFRLAQEHALGGQTGERTARAVEAIAQLWVHWGQLNELIEKAAAARRSLPRFRQAQALAAIARQLTEPTVVTGVAEVPIEQRGLLTAAEQTRRTTPEALKEEMAQAFARARTTLLELDAAWKRNNQALAELGAEAQRLQGQVEAHRRGTPAEVSDLLARLQSLRKRARRDPLSVPADLHASLRPYFERARERLASFERERRKVGEDLQRAHAELEALRALRVATLKAHQECMAKVEVADAPAAPASVKDLGEWLGRLEAAHAAGAAESVRRGFAEWSAARTAREAALRQVTQASEALLARRLELLERWAHAAARTQARAAELAADRALANFREKAKTLLTGRVPLEQADLIVHAYEVRLAERLAQLGE